MRLLYSGEKECGCSCQYCFAHCITDKSSFTKISTASISEKEAIIYPCCDCEFSDQDLFVDSIRNISKKLDKVYISMSTKKDIDDYLLNTIASFNNELVSEKKGFIKIGISLSNKKRIKEIEPNTASYEKRLEVARKITNYNIPLGLTIKPILPFIDVDEYLEILDDYKHITDKVLIGGLYVNTNSTFYKEYELSRYVIEKRKVEWLPDRPEWDYIKDLDKEQRIINHAICNGIMVFESDVDFVRTIAEEIGE